MDFQIRNSPLGQKRLLLLKQLLSATHGNSIIRVGYCQNARLKAKLARDFGQSLGEILVVRHAGCRQRPEFEQTPPTRNSTRGQAVPATILVLSLNGQPP